MNRSITVLSLIVFVLVGIGTASDDIDMLFAKLSAIPNFQCSLQVTRFSTIDTAITDGIVIWKGKKFLIHVGDEHYLHDGSGELLAWTEGADAIPYENLLPFGDWKNFRARIEEKYIVSSLKQSDGTYLIVGVSKGSSPVAKFELTMNSDAIPIKIILRDAINNRTELRFTKRMNEIPDDSTFMLPRGVEIIR